MLTKVFILMERRIWILLLKILDKNGDVVGKKNYEIKSYLFSFDCTGKGILKFTDCEYRTIVFHEICSCFADGSSTAFKSKDNTTFLVCNG